MVRKAAALWAGMAGAGPGPAGEERRFGEVEEMIGNLEKDVQAAPIVAWARRMGSGC